jgi:hypothetical protein
VAAGNAEQGNFGKGRCYGHYFRLFLNQF